jgi:hypothetical protein
MKPVATGVPAALTSRCVNVGVAATAPDERKTFQLFVGPVPVLSSE